MAFVIAGDHSDTGIQETAAAPLGGLRLPYMFGFLAYGMRRWKQQEHQSRDLAAGKLYGYGYRHFRSDSAHRSGESYR